MNPNLSPAQQAKALNSIRLTGLDKFPGNKDREPTSADKRWKRRIDYWRMAKVDRQRLQTNDSIAVRELIVQNVQGRGMFSIWWTVFEDDVDMRRRLREAFKGSAKSCFDADEKAVSRPEGQL